MTDKTAARSQIADLVQRFQQTPRRTREGYNEAQTRQYFLMPLFRALGWDTENPAEVVPEDPVSGKRADYGFYLDGVPRFFLETKSIKVNLHDPALMKQAINYAYLKGVTWAVLSDFAGLLILNAEWEESDPRKSIFLQLNWEQYANGQFDDLWLLAKPAIQAGAINDLAEKYGGKTRKRPVTEQLFAQLTQWRHELFKEIRGWDATLWSTDPCAVDNAVQRLLDRLIFIRTVEDREIEAPRLRPLVRQYQERKRSPANIFSDLQALFREMDGVYNARLFAESTVDHVEIHDPDLLIAIINGLYEMPGGFISYDFDTIDADVLGAIYEQYLGFKAQDPQGETAIDLGKRSKRKSQGIYYTPQFVVRYIVQNTLGRLLEDGADPHTLRILDPACGSGSFLIEAFDVLDRWLAQHGTAEDRAFPRRRRLRILQENLYGVDLDEQAVEVARLNLLLRAAGERGKLPMLTNIRRGNSLIDDPAVAGDAAFKWEEEFPEVFADGGFDVVIGNPPYIRIQTLPREQVVWLGEAYASATSNYDIYIPFAERGLQLLNPNGLLGYILPHKFFTAKYGKNLRSLIASGKNLHELVYFGDQQVFANATTYTCIMTLSKTGQDKFRFIDVQNIDDWLSGDAPEGILNADSISADMWTFVIGPSSHVQKRLEMLPVRAKDAAARIAQGIRTSANEIYVLRIVDTDDTGLVTAFSESLQRTIKLERDLLFKFLRGREIKPYHISPSELVVIVPYHLTETDNVELVSEHDLAQSFPLTYSYLCENKTLLEARENNRMHGPGWYGYVYPKNLEVMLTRKILVPDIAAQASFALDDDGSYAFTSGYGITLHPHSQEDMKYMLGLLNSRLLDFFFKNISTTLRGGFYRYFSQYIEQLPIRTINFNDPAEVAQHDRMVALVEDMLRLKREHAEAEAAFDDRRHELTARIEQVDREIDALVYALYGLTDEEIAIVEGRA